MHYMVKDPFIDQVPLPDQTTFKISLQPCYSEGSDHTLQGPRWQLYHYIAGILKLLLASGCRNGDWSRSGSKKLNSRKVAPLPYKNPCMQFHFSFSIWYDFYKSSLLQTKTKKGEEHQTKGRSCRTSRQFLVLLLFSFYNVYCMATGRMEGYQERHYAHRPEVPNTVVTTLVFTCRLPSPFFSPVLAFHKVYICPPTNLLYSQ
jgi:hypothetical protein